jgi:hypothetical protein
MYEGMKKFIWFFDWGISLGPRLDSKTTKIVGKYIDSYIFFSQFSNILISQKFKEISSMSTCTHPFNFTLVLSLEN